MSDLYLRLEVQDENDQAFTVIPDRDENRGLGCTLRRYNKSQLSYAVRNVNSIKSRIVKGKEVSVRIGKDRRKFAGQIIIDSSAR